MYIFIREIKRVTRNVSITQSAQVIHINDILSVSFEATMIKCAIHSQSSISRIVTITVRLLLSMNRNK